VDWIHLAPDGEKWRAFLNAVASCSVNGGEFLDYCVTISISREKFLHGVSYITSGISDGQCVLTGSRDLNHIRQHVNVMCVFSDGYNVY
jgi:hypothetical protein